jgi:hypothetical protein
MGATLPVARGGSITFQVEQILRLDLKLRPFAEQLHIASNYETNSMRGDITPGVTHFAFDWVD